MTIDSCCIDICYLNSEKHCKSLGEKTLRLAASHCYFHVLILDQQTFVGLCISFNLVSKLIHLQKGTTLKCSYYLFINHLCIVATCMSCGLNWPGLQSCVAKIRPKGSSHKHGLCCCFEVVKGVTGVSLCACMSKTHFLLCSVSSAWMCTLKQHQQARTPLRMRTTKMRRRRRSWRSSRRQSTTSLQIKRIWKRWWTGADAALPHHSRLFFLFLWFEGPPFSLLGLYYFAPFFLETLPPLSGSRVLCWSAWSLEWHHTQPVCNCSSLLTLARLAKRYSVYMRLKQTCLLHSDLNIDWYLWVLWTHCKAFMGPSMNYFG